MPAMLRPNDKASKIAERILGLPATLKKDYNKKKKEVGIPGGSIYPGTPPNNGIGRF